MRIIMYTKIKEYNIYFEGGKNINSFNEKE